MIQSIAQWEEQEYLVLSLPHSGTDWAAYLGEILKSYEDLVSKACKYTKVLLLAPDQACFEPFKRFKNVEFFKIQTDDTWVRDYGGIDVKCGDKILANDFIFNAWGEKYASSKDNEVNDKLYAHLKMPLKKHDFILEGGSIDVNGAGTLMSTATCLYNANRNSKLSKDEILAKLKATFGVNRLIILENGFIKGDDTDSHIDTLARFITPKTIAYMKCEDENDLHFKPLKAMEKELEATGFELLPLPLPAAQYYEGKRLGATYTNFIFINSALIVPIYADDADELVLKRLGDALPGRDIVAVDARVFLRQNGSLHCASQNIYAGKR